MNPSSAAPKTTLSLQHVRAVKGSLAVKASLQAGITFQKITYTDAANPVG